MPEVATTPNELQQEENASPYCCFADSFAIEGLSAIQNVPMALYVHNLFDPPGPSPSHCADNDDDVMPKLFGRLVNGGAGRL